MAFLAPLRCLYPCSEHLVATFYLLVSSPLFPESSRHELISQVVAIKIASMETPTIQMCRFRNGLMTILAMRLESILAWV